MNAREFQELIWEKGRELYRDMPWRQDTRPYYIVVSELMLQQTQVDRVIPKFLQFIKTFPDIETLAKAPLADVLTQWSGLGYNRRAKFLHELAKKVQSDFEGVIPSAYDALITLPGIGPNTAGAILAYSFNTPTHFIETNIRTVYFYHFFPNELSVSDAALKEVIQEMTDAEHPREWYWALMDYGSYLKKQGVGRNDQSKHYKKQAPLKGSLREVRGMILKELTVNDQSLTALKKKLPDDTRFKDALSALKREGMIKQSGDRLHLTR